ncbi:MAG: DUF5682 family protein [Oscillospiraceae bacterium]|nr:DUF5682 family protein [Oscillospiraceae bacterium]
MVKIFGIRHMSPNCAKQFARGFLDYKPDIVLLEIPCDMTGHLDLCLAPASPPVALMAYTQSLPVKSVILPLASYSPEYIALVLCKKYNVPYRGIDLPSSVFAGKATSSIDGASAFERYALSHNENSFEDAWERSFEHISNNFFEATESFGRQLRINLIEDKYMALREGFMQTEIAKALQEGFCRIAVLCGAYHAPPLADGTALSVAQPPKAEHMKISVIPYSYRRMASQSGYGGGNACPRYYEKLFEHPPQDVPALFLTELACEYRKCGAFVSTADVQDAVSLAYSLGACKNGRPVYSDLRDAGFYCFGKKEKLQRALDVYAIGENTGVVPPGVSFTPLCQDFREQLELLKIKLPKDGSMRLSLRLGDRLGREQSVFLHRLGILNLPIARKVEVPAGASGLREDWMISSCPETDALLVMLAGNTIEQASSLILQDTPAIRPQEVTKHLENLLLCSLPGLLSQTIHRLDKISETLSDLTFLMNAGRMIDRFLSGYAGHEFDVGELQSLLFRLLHRCRAVLTAGREASLEVNRELLLKLPGLYQLASRHQGISSDFLDWCRVWSQTSHPLIAGCAAAFLLENNLGHDNQILRSVLFSGDMEAGQFWLEGFLTPNRTAVLYNREFWETIADIARENPRPSRHHLILTRMLSALTELDKKILHMEYPDLYLQIMPDKSDVLTPLYITDSLSNIKKPGQAVAWLGLAQEQYSPSEICQLQRDALQLPGFAKHLNHPSVLEFLVPDQALTARLLSRPLECASLPKARKMIEDWIETVLPQIEKTLKGNPKLRGSVGGGKNKTLDFKRTIRHNIGMYDTREQRLNVGNLFFKRPLESSVRRDLYILIDRSGSMSESTINGALLGCVLTRLPFFRVRLFVFSEKTQEINITVGKEALADFLLTLPYDGSTDLSGALDFLKKEIDSPSMSHVILVSDLMDMGSPQLLGGRMEELLSYGVRLTALLSLSDQGIAEYDRGMVNKFISMGADCRTISLSQVSSIL